MRSILYIILGLLVVLTIGVLANSHADIPVEQLKEKYELPNGQYLLIDGMEVHYSIEGKGDTLVLFHGTGGSVHDWNRWMPHLKDSFTIVRLDLPGFGLTGPNPEGIYSVAFYMQFLKHFFQELQLDHFHLGGNSFGGFLAWNFALVQPEMVEKLVLLNASGYPKSPKDWPLGFRLARDKNWSWLLTSITPKSLIWKTAYDVYEDDSQVTVEIVDRYFELLLRSGNREGLVGRMQQADIEAYKNIPKVTSPTLILWGEKDKVVSVEDGWRYQKDLPNSRFIIFPSVGHVPMEEDPKQSAAAARLFLLEKE